jgi:hypothetical protein
MTRPSFHTVCLKSASKGGVGGTQDTRALDDWFAPISPFRGAITETETGHSRRQEFLKFKINGKDGTNYPYKTKSCYHLSACLLVR